MANYGRTKKKKKTPEAQLYKNSLIKFSDSEKRTNIPYEQRLFRSTIVMQPVKMNEKTLKTENVSKMFGFLLSILFMCSNLNGNKIKKLKSVYALFIIHVSGLLGWRGKIEKKRRRTFVQVPNI